MLHELLLALSGFPGSMFVENDNRIQVAEQVSFLLDSEKILLNRILHVASEYKALKNFVDHQNDLYYSTLMDEYNPNGSDQQCPGMYLQAFCNGLEEVLDPYKQELVNLELEILKDPCLSLTYILSYVHKHECLMHMMNSLVKEVKENHVRGCYLLEFLHRHSNSGIEEVKRAMKLILKSCHTVFLKQLCSWLLYGQLIDSYCEFIIYHKTDLETSLSSSSPDSDSSPGNVIEDNQFGKKNQLQSTQYAVRHEMLPPYIPLSLARKILYVGETILSCGNDPKEFLGIQISLRKNKFSIFGKKENYYLGKILQLQKLESFSVMELEEIVDEIKLSVTEHLWTLAMEDAQLYVQLRLMKDFFLLGRGELFQEFIRQADCILSGPPVSSTCKDINHCLRVAAAKMLVEDDPSVEKFHFTLVDNSHSLTNWKSTAGTENGWSRLTLTYQPSWPLQNLFSPPILENYNILFHFLLRVKKTQIDLHNVWREHMQHKSRCDPVVWQLRNCLMFVINNLQYYLQVDVLESQYSILQNVFHSTKDFDVICKAHSSFQANIMSQTFLFLASEVCSGDGEIEAGSSKVDNPVHSCLSNLLSLAESFCLKSEAGALKNGGVGRGFRSELKGRGQSWAEEIMLELERLMVFLMQLLSGLRSHPSGTHLSQLLLRLDYNGWFSKWKMLRIG